LSLKLNEVDEILYKFTDTRFLHVSPPKSPHCHSSEDHHGSLPGKIKKFPFPDLLRDISHQSFKAFIPDKAHRSICDHSGSNGPHVSERESQSDMVASGFWGCSNLTKYILNKI